MRRTALTTAILLAAAAPAAALPPDTLLGNGSFEDPAIAQGTFGIFGAIPSWSHAPRAGTTSSGIELQHRVAGQPAAGAGNQFVELDSDGPSEIFQDVAAQPGLRHRLAFLSSPRPGTTAAQNHFSVTAGSATLEVGPLAGGAATAWTGADLSFVASSATTRIAFLDLGPEESAGGLGAYVDEVSVVPVYDLCLLYDPAKSHRAGSTVPIRLRLCDASGANLSSPALVLHAVSLSRVDSSASSVVEDAGEANADDDFRYDADLAGYIFNLSTGGLSSGTWKLVFSVAGGSTTYAVTFDVR